MDNDTLVIRVNAFLSAKDMEKIRTYVLEQQKTGVIILPVYCEPILVPKDVEIKFEEETNNHAS